MKVKTKIFDLQLDAAGVGGGARGAASLFTEGKVCLKGEVKNILDKANEGE